MSNIAFGFQNADGNIAIQLANGVFEFPLSTRQGTLSVDDLYISADSISMSQHLGYEKSSLTFMLEVSVASKGGTPTVTANFEGAVMLYDLDTGMTKELRSGEPVELQG
jgi:hypothetical protein